MSYCGIYCGRCKDHKQNQNCSGCRDEKSLVDDCPTRRCGMARGLLHCGQCTEFPCGALAGYYHDGMPLHEQAYLNMRELLADGVDAWLGRQNALEKD